MGQNKSKEGWLMKRKLRELFGDLNKVRPQHVEEKTIYNFAFGALHALCKSSELGYAEHARLKITDEEGEVYKTVRLLAQQAEQGNLPTDRPWLAGFFFNDALIKLDISFEHLARFDTNYRKRCSRKKLTKKCRPKLKDIIDGPWQTIRSNVNQIKHQSIPTDSTENLQFEEIIPVAQQLLKGMVWITNNRPSWI